MSITATNPAWLRIYNESVPVRAWFKRGLLLYGTAVYLLSVYAIHSGNPWLAFAGELLLSQLPVNLVGWLLEDRGAWKIDGRNQIQRRFDPKVQSSAFLADFNGLGPMMAMSAAVYPLLPHFFLFNGSIVWQAVWVVLPVLPAAFGAWSFRKGEGDVYDALRYNCLTKLLHNGVAFTGLFAVIIGVVPMLVTALIYGLATAHWLTSVFAVIGLAGLGIWARGAMKDGKRAALPDDDPRALRAKNLHPQVDKWGRRLMRRNSDGQWITTEFEDIPTWDEFLKVNPETGLSWHSIFHTRKMLPIVRGLFARFLKGRGNPHEDPNLTLPPVKTDDRTDQGWTGQPPDRPD